MLLSGTIKFRTRENVAVVISTCGEHPAIGEQRRRVEEPSIIEAPCDRPISRGRIVATGHDERSDDRFLSYGMLLPALVLTT